MKYVIAEVGKGRAYVLSPDEGRWILTRRLTETEVVVPQNSIVMTIRNTYESRWNDLWKQSDYTFYVVEKTKTKTIATVTIKFRVKVIEGRHKRTRIPADIQTEPRGLRETIMYKRVDQETGRKKKITWEKAIKDAFVEFIQSQVLLQ